MADIRVTWTAPSSSGSAAVTGYVVALSNGATTTVGNVLTTTMTGLAAGLTLTATVRAITSFGTGPASPASVAYTIPAAASTTPATGATSTPARWWIANGGAPTVRPLYSTGVNGDGRAQVDWVGSMPDSRAATSPREVGVPTYAQNGYQAYVVDLSTSSTVADSGVVSSAAETWTAPSFSPVPGRAYRAHVRVRSADGQWSAYANTRFVAPTGVTRYFEDFGAVGDGSTPDGSAVRTAIDSCNPGDVLRSKNPGTVLTSVSVSGTALTSATAVFTSAMVGKPVLIHRAGTTTSATNSYAHRSSITSVASDGKSAVLAAAAPTAVTSTRAIVGIREFLVGHVDVDGGLNNGGVNAKRGGQIIDGTGCIFTSTNVDSAGFRTTLPDVVYRFVHFWQKVATVRGGGLNNNTGPFFIESTGAVGIRVLGCYAERARDAGFLLFGGPSDVHFVDCTTDHCNADPFHVTGSAHDIQWIRNLSILAGDDATANIGYRGDGDGARPYNITWENPRMIGQDWGRGLSFGGCRDVLATDVVMSGGAMASFLIGSDGDQANTARVQIRGGTITTPNLSRGTKPTYTQGSGSNSTITDEPWLKLLNSGSTTRQRDILIEGVTVTDGRYLQIISYGGGAFEDATVILRGITMNGSVNSGSNWADQGTYPGHIDLRGISVPSGSTAASAPTAANS